jgi:hypothetical protein
VCGAVAGLEEEKYCAHQEFFLSVSKMPKMEEARMYTKQNKCFKIGMMLPGCSEVSQQQPCDANHRHVV